MVLSANSIEHALLKLACYTVGGANVAVVERAYDELIRIHGFGVNGDMTEKNLKVAHDLALQNHEIKQAIPLDQWVDFRFQNAALESLGRFAG